MVSKNTWLPRRYSDLKAWSTSFNISYSTAYIKAYKKAYSSSNNTSLPSKSDINHKHDVYVQKFDNYSIWHHHKLNIKLHSIKHTIKNTAYYKTIINLTIKCIVTWLRSTSVTQHRKNSLISALIFRWWGSLNHHCCFSTDIGEAMTSSMSLFLSRSFIDILVPLE